jgi:hypothetical protein
MRDYVFYKQIKKLKMTFGNNIGLRLYVFYDLIVIIFQIINFKVNFLLVSAKVFFFQICEVGGLVISHNRT